MVGPPKSLHDLRRVEGAVRVTCRACGSTRLWDREELIHFRTAHRKSCDWSVVQRDMSCSSPACDSTDVRVDGVAFGQNATELKQRRGQMLLVNLALKTLSDACYRAPTGIDHPPVRLALRVLAPHVREQDMLVQLWQHLADKPDQISAHPHLVLRWIICRLVARGYAVWAELR